MKLRSTLRTTSLPLAVTALSFAPLTLMATDGYFADGYGTKSKGRAGVAIAQTDDAFGGANNPATVSWVGERLDVGAEWFHPVRSASRSGPAAPLNGSVDSWHENFFIPEFAYARPIRPDLSLGITVYGNGGMNTDYPAGQLNLGPGASGLNLLAAPGALGVNLSQLLVAPTLAWKPTENQSIGLAPILAYQRFKAYGLGAFAPFSQNAAALTDAGIDQSWGGGARLGYFARVSDRIDIGVTYSSPIYSQRFEKYAGLFANGGEFDIPQSLGAGVAWKATDSLKVGADYKWIDYSGVDSVGRTGGVPNPLGSATGPGFGWRSISVAKAGIDWQVASAWTLRAGYSFNQNPIPADEVTFNILAPAVVQHHLTLGFTYTSGSHEFSLAYVHALHGGLSGPSRLVNLGFAPAGTTETIAMTQDSVAIAYGFKF